MHEFSIATGVVDVAVKHAAGRPVTLVRLRVGALRQVVRSTLAFAFEIAARGTPCEGAQLEQELVAGRLLCTECTCEWAVEELDFRCRSCGGPAIVIAGRELEVESIEVEERK